MGNVTVNAAVASNTLLGLYQQNDRNLADFIVSDLLDAAPFLAAAFAQPATGRVKHEFTVEVEAPGATFRTVGAGRSNAAGKAKTVEIALMLLDASFERDLALAIGSAKGIEGYMNSEGRKSLKAAFAKLDKQLIQGTGAVADGFFGLGDFIDKYNPSMQKLVTASAGSTVYMGIFGEDAVSVVSGDGGTITIGDITDVLSYDSSSNPFNALSLPIMSWLGLQVAGSYNLARLCNVAQTGASNTLDDDLLLDLLKLFPSDRRPNFLLMHRNDAINLAKSRTATSITGAAAPVPQVWNGAGYDIPIILDDAVLVDTTVTTTTTAEG